jgi:hypothetical protein
MANFFEVKFEFKDEGLIPTIIELCHNIRPRLSLQLQAPHSTPTGLEFPCTTQGPSFPFKHFSSTSSAIERSSSYTSTSLDPNQVSWKITQA